MVKIIVCKKCGKKADIITHSTGWYKATERIIFHGDDIYSYDEDEFELGYTERHDEKYECNKCHSKEECIEDLVEVKK